ncbi:MAG: hypothetical protein AAF957_03340 [Planctomycetota bacterium]
MQIPSQRTQISAAAAPTRPAATPGPVRPQAVQADAATRTRAADATPEGEDSGDVRSHLARLDGFAEALMERFKAAAQDAPESERPAFREAFASLESGLARLRAGLADGSIQPTDVQRGVGNLFESARGMLTSARAGEQAAEGEGTGDDASVGDVVRDRFQGFADSVLARLEAADMPADEREAMAQGVAEAFASATARLDAALFDPQTGDPIDRGTYMDLFSASLGALQEHLSKLFGEGDDGRSNGVVYDADRAKQGLTPRGQSLDLAG